METSELTSSPERMPGMKSGANVEAPEMAGSPELVAVRVRDGINLEALVVARGDGLQIVEPPPPKRRILQGV